LLLQACIKKKLLPTSSTSSNRDEIPSSNQETEQKPKPFSEFHAFTLAFGDPLGHIGKVSGDPLCFSWFAKTHRIHGTGIFTNIYHKHQLNVLIKWDVSQKIVGVFPPNHPLKDSGFPFINPTIFGVLPLFLETPKFRQVTGDHVFVSTFPKCDTF